ncbi:MAG: Thioesterase superfamily protein [Candidatus Methanofastidiosum methylothiophilum]|jgi:acyl-CoA thioesterase|uniref:Thioesterase superfamily protein n=1 Tax=Candidatus Methanofastidiosum methylothiophilum TaxID=1705564 RepID=A0A150JHA6_9EURY|nr:MAG: Thioesterase superfamily protein [Candidatus Methanofastidiosum methylthiophilus]OQC49916.1 MAG: Thioesterase superfamily protein [Euryarchaeota archaeon ADurb.Bin023]HOE93187.1 PaaI family thioesterase [Methanofastidiosum sp.]KYC56627.1 MAG: Thioesterase superfamily protein [Candidatus Methanofastidiosum methylthiophilus]KYC58352.1 MAG: Thioesterase superfamily protein [Candidatus Methanofastidiosum methylthiophilus]
MDFIKEFIENDKFAKSVGIELLEVSLGYAKAKMEIKEIHHNSINTVHGGAIFTLADFTFAVAANSHNKMSVALNVNISFLKAISEGVLIAEAQEISVNPKIATYKILVSNDLGELIATFEGMAYRKERSLVKE